MRVEVKKKERNEVEEDEKTRRRREKREGAEVRDRGVLRFFRRARTKRKKQNEGAWLSEFSGIRAMSKLGASFISLSPFSESFARSRGSRARWKKRDTTQHTAGVLGSRRIESPGNLTSLSCPLLRRLYLYENKALPAPPLPT